MPGPFEIATKAAISELIQTHAQSSKFGWILSHESTEELIGAIFDLLSTSRNLKAAGDRFLGQAAAPQNEPKALRKPARPFK